VATATKDRELRTGTYPSRRAQRYQQRKVRARHRIIAAASTVVLVAGVALVVMVSGGDGKTETTTPFVGSTLNVVLGDFTIAGDLAAPAGDVRLQAVNQGAIVHNVGIRRGPISGDMQSGGTFTIGLGTLAPGTYQLYCDIVGHVESGMVADLVIT
jgi:plastocyanin